MRSSLPRNNTRGFTLVEMLTVLAIFVILFSIGTYALTSSRNRKSADVVTDAITFKLEEAKADSISGKGGTSFGIKFNANSYVVFSGSTYNASDAANTTIALPDGISMSATIPGADTSVIFARRSGVPNVTGTITISNTRDVGHLETITVDTQGDITVVK